MSRDFDKEIEVAEKTFAETVAKMEACRQEFVRATTALLTPWFMDEAQKIARETPDVTKNLGEVRLGALKEKIRLHQVAAPTLVEKFMSAPDLWWHKKPGQQMYFVSERRGPEHLERAVRLIAGSVAPILEDYGYLTLPGNTNGMGAWLEWDESGNYHPHDARPYCPRWIDWSEPMKTPIKTYEELRRQAERERNAVERLKTEKEQSEANDIWNRS